MTGHTPNELMRHDVVNIAELAQANEDFRREIVTGRHAQVVVMTIPAGEEIGEEVHDGNDQVLLFLEGTGEARIGGQVAPIGPNSLAFVPAGTVHNFINTGNLPLRLVTFYGPPEMAPGTVHHTKAEAEAAEADEHGH